MTDSAGAAVILYSIHSYWHFITSWYSSLR